MCILSNLCQLRRFIVKTMTDFKIARKNMVDCQIRPSGVVNPVLLQSFENVPRELFVPEKLQHIAYSDENIDIGQGRFLIEPITHAKLLQAADLKEDDVVLDIGVGSGYSSAILSNNVAMIIALEVNKRQIDKATRLWERLGFCNIALVESALNSGEEKHAPYTLIVINGAVPEVPDIILEQLTDNGRLITVVKDPSQVFGKAMIFLKDSLGNISSKPLFDTGIPHLKGFEVKNDFEF